MMALLLSCATVEEPSISLLDPRRQLIRASVDLRGIHPSEEELAFVEEHPEAYDQLVVRYLEDPRFLDTVESIFHSRLLTRTGETFFDPAEAELGRMDPGRVADSVGDEPLKLARYVVDQDLPWSQVLLAEHSMADPVLAQFWGMERQEGPGWQPAWYSDGRQHAGVLTMTTTWLRFPSAGVNANRHRANTVSRVFLCDDFLARPVSFSRSQIDALTTGDPEEVIADTPACQSCHSSLDPLAAHFFGFWWELEGGLVEQTTYRPEDEGLWREHAGRHPGFFGQPTADIVDLATYLAEDPRFSECAVETFWEALTQRQASNADWDELAVHREVFEDSGQSVKALVRSVVLSEAYRAHATTDPELAERLVTVKTLSPERLASVVEHRTGYRWEIDGRDALVRNVDGLGVLAGGIDARDVTVASHDPSVGLLFVQERLAWSAAWEVARHDLDPEREGEARLLRYVTVEDSPSSAPEAFEAQIRALYLEITGLPLPEQASEPLLLATLWEEVHSVEGDPVQAWAAVLAVVLRDPDLLLY